jgi:predicted AAA+ superfamily ATPase
MNRSINGAKKDIKNYILVDEVQLVTDFHIAIKSLALDENNDIYLTGSKAQMLSADLANELCGRYIEFPVYSLSICSFLIFTNSKIPTMPSKNILEIKSVYFHNRMSGF